MKANLPQNEPKLLAKWAALGLYERIREARGGRPLYVLHDGPPYANGPLHLGHALNKCLKDFVVKSKTMFGFDSPYIPGWDCHGLPIEIKVDEALGRKKLEMQPLQVRKACREYAEKFVKLQRDQFVRLGVFGQWDDPYLTMSPRYEAAIMETLFSFFENGLIYRGLRPVYWCIVDKTALAEAEVEYEDHTSPSVWVKYRLTSDPAQINSALAGKKASTIIWTTTPWTLPASLAVAFHPNEEYVALEAGGEVYMVAAKLARVTAEKTGLAGAKQIARFPGERMERVTFAHPFLERSILGVLAEYVTMDQGTGAVHTAPSHGADDFYTGGRYGLDQTCNVDEAGRLRHGLPEYDGETVFDANPNIIELLKTRGALLAEEKITHSYPHCWRCHNPVIFRATEQWFIGMENRLAGGETLRQKALDEARRVKFDPAWGEERIGNMIATRPDWCISRQRVWGVPIAVFFCEGCGGVLNDHATNQAVIELFRTRGADAWYSTDPAGIVPRETKCAKCGGGKFRKEMDIIDVWFESGSSQAAVLTAPEGKHVPAGPSGLPFPCDMYLEGGDQYRGWFMSSLFCAVGARGRAPYRQVVTPGWTLDEQGRAMSKSRGNDVDPVDVANRLGGEIVRLWVASVDFREDVIGSENLMQRVAENYRKIRNTFRYILGNLNGFDPARDAVPFAEMQPLDQYMLLRTAELTERVRQWYEEFAFHKIYHRVNDFCVVDLSAFYFDVLKDRLYTASPRGVKRRSAQTAIWRIGEALVRLMAPIMSFTADEIWQFLPPVAGREPSAHLALFPDVKDAAGDTAGADTKALMADWDALMAVRQQVLKPLEVARQEKLIGDSTEAFVHLSAPEPVYTILDRYRPHLRELLKLSGVSVEREGGNGSTPLRVKVSKAPGRKCERCWNYSQRVGEDPQYPTVCERCAPVLHELENGGI